MSLMDINWRPATKQVREFAAACAVLLPVLGWWWGAGAVVVWLAGLGVVLFAASWLAPRAVAPLFVAASLLAAPIGFVVGELAMLAVFFGVVTPLGVVLRWFGRDKLHRGSPGRQVSYWRRKSPPKDTASYYRQS